MIISTVGTSLSFINEESCPSKNELINSVFFFFLFFYQNDLHVLLPKQFYKKNCEIIKTKLKLIEKKHIIKRWQNIYETLTTSFGC